MGSTVKINFDGALQQDIFLPRINVFYAGQRVTGTVDISLVETKRVKCISFQIYGFTKTHWDGGSPGKTTYDGYENYFTSKQYLIGTEDDTPRDIQPGSYHFKFSCNLPEQLPSSFEGTYGHVRYMAMVSLERPWSIDKTYSEALIVRKPLDLTTEVESLSNPSEVELLQQFWCGICTSKAIHIKGKLPRSGFVPGEVIPFDAEVNNSSNVDIKQLRVILQCIVSYQADTPELDCRQEIKDLVCKVCDPIPKNSQISIKKDFIVPAVPSSSNSSYSKLIQIAYCIRIEAVTSYLHKNAYILCPITIGTVSFFNHSLDKIERYHKLSPAIENSHDPLPLLESVRSFVNSSKVDVTEL